MPTCFYYLAMYPKNMVSWASHAEQVENVESLLMAGLEHTGEKLYMYYWISYKFTPDDLAYACFENVGTTVTFCDLTDMTGY